MLDDDHRVAEIPQSPQRIEQAGVITLVQTDGRLIEHVQHTREARADLRCEANTLAFAAGQSAGGAGQRQIVQADVEQE